MSVCMSAVSAGVSEVLIKYTGNEWLQTPFSILDIKYFAQKLNVGYMIL